MDIPPNSVVWDYKTGVSLVINYDPFNFPPVISFEFENSPGSSSASARGKSGVAHVIFTSGLIM